MKRVAIGFFAGALFFYLASAIAIAGAIRYHLNYTAGPAIGLGLLYPYWITCFAFCRDQRSVLPKWALYRPRLGWKPIPELTEPPMAYGFMTPEFNDPPLSPGDSSVLRRHAERRR